MTIFAQTGQFEVGLLSLSLGNPELKRLEL